MTREGGDHAEQPAVDLHDGEHGSQRPLCGSLPVVGLLGRLPHGHLDASLDGTG